MSNKRWQKHHESHTYMPGECRWHTVTARSSTARVRGAGRLKASSEPTAGLPGTIEGEELGAGDEKKARESPDPHRHPSGRRREPHPADIDGKAEEANAGPERPDNWTNFDIRNVLVGLRFANEAGRRRILRKLHIRWWHATSAQMVNILKHAGAPKEVLDIIPSIVDTCEACRKWQRPGPDAQATSSVSENFNDIVEGDLVYYKEQPILHLVDRCTRWHAAVLVPSRTTKDLIEAIDTSWIRVFGPMKKLVLDMETAIYKSFTAGDYLERKGIKYEARAVGQHARYAERRGELFKETVRKIAEQLKKENLNVPLNQIISEAVFAGNALLTVNNTTPYNAVFGRVPHLLPDENQYHDPDNELGEGKAQGLAPSSARLREISLQKMIEGSAIERVNRARRAKTQPPFQLTDLKVGDQVDFYRKPMQKDISGWLGPATVVNVLDARRGHIDVKWQSKTLTCKHAHLRRHLIPLWSMLAFSGNMYQPSYDDKIHNLLGQLKSGDSRMYGHLIHDGKWVRTRETREHPSKWKNIRYYARNMLQISNVKAARVFRSMAIVPSTKEGFENSTLILWMKDRDTEFVRVDYDPREPYRLRAEFPNLWSKITGLQLLIGEPEDAITDLEDDDDDNSIE